MNTQLSIVEFIQRQLSQQEQNYMTALGNGKSNIELKEIEFEIQYLKKLPSGSKESYSTLTKWIIYC